MQATEKPASAGKQIMIVTGEASGDLHAAKLVRSLSARLGDASFFGIGGGALQAAGVTLLYPSRRLAVVGITEVLRRLPDILQGWRTACRAIRRLGPDLLILVDFPDFNLRLAKFAARRGVPVLYYISPQIWAWRAGRVHQIKQRVKHIAVILPFEAAFYRRHGVPVTFVGHPLLDQTPQTPPELHPTGPGLSAGLRAGGAGLTISLLPGSRATEIQRHLPLMLDAALRVQQVFPNLGFVVAPAPEADRAAIARLCASWADRITVHFEPGGACRVLARSHLAVAVSGTVTLEAALAGVPTIIIYKVSRLSYALGKALIRVPYIGLINLIANAPVAPELIQDQATPANIAALLLRLLQDQQHCQTLRRRMQSAVRRLGAPGAADRTANIALRLLQAPSSC